MVKDERCDFIVLDSVVDGCAAQVKVLSHVKCSFLDFVACASPPGEPMLLDFAAGGKKPVKVKLYLDLK